MTRYSNLWTDGQNIIKFETHPGEFFYPVVAMSRVRGSSYIPYKAKDGSKSWVKAANRSLASHARSNFERNVSE